MKGFEEDLLIQSYYFIVSKKRPYIMQELLHYWPWPLNMSYNDPEVDSY